MRVEWFPGRIRPAIVNDTPFTSLRVLSPAPYAAEEYWSFTRGNPADNLSPNLEALAFLTSLPKLKKYILTNCAEKQAKEALETLGLAGQFEGNVYGADAMGEVCKPDVAAFEKIIAASGIDPKRTAFFEDSVKNLAAAKTLRMTTVLIASHTSAEEGKREDGFVADFTVSTVTEAEVRAVLPGLWR